MLLFLLAYLGGILTILSPCILPVLPFVFARGDKPFLSNGLPLLAGMAVTFAGVATLAALGGGWAVTANSVGRAVALTLFAGFALLLIFPSLSERACARWSGWGERLSVRADRGGVGSSCIARRRHGPAVGALRRPDPRHNPDRSGAVRSERDHRRPVARLCPRRGDQPGPRASGRRHASSPR